jgi:hypothetical protein
MPFPAWVQYDRVISMKSIVTIDYSKPDEEYGEMTSKNE